MKWWHELFGEPKCDPKPVVITTMEDCEDLPAYKYLAQTEENIKLVIDRYNHLIKTSDGDILVYDGYVHELSHLCEYSIFEIKNAEFNISFYGSYVRFHMMSGFSFYRKKDVRLMPTYMVSLSAWELFQDFVNLGVVEKSTKKLILEKIPKCDPNIDSDIWYSINNGEYYSLGGWLFYRFSDWELLTLNDNEKWDLIKDVPVEKCENPKKTYWKHFLDLDMKKKHKRDADLKKWVDSVLAKKIEYDDLNFKYGNLPAAPIVDARSFLNFCKLVSEKNEFNDYEIENYLMILKHKYNVENSREKK